MTAAPNSYVARFLPLRLPRVCVAVTDYRSRRPGGQGRGAGSR